MHELLRPLQATAYFCSLTYLEPFVTLGAMAISDDDLTQRAEDYAATLKTEALPALEPLG